VSDAPRKPTYEELEAENRALRAQLASVLKRLDELERAGKRQAAPFSKGPPKADPKPPGRKPGEDYGRQYSGVRPERIDETYDVPHVASCPDCGGDVAEECVAEQFQRDVPVIRPIHRHFRLHVGRCTKCRARLQPRHPLQTSDAIGAAAVQLGPRALVLAAKLGKVYGLSYEKTQDFFAQHLGLEAARATFCRANARLARKLEGEYDAMRASIRDAPVANADETGWKTGGERRWLWVVVTPAVTVYRIARSRGGDIVDELLGRGFRGILCRDGWAPYRQLALASHQSCLAHHLARAREILEVAQRGAAKFAHALTRVLKAALDLRDRREEVSAHGFAVARGRVAASLDRLLAWNPQYAPNARFVKHLRRERSALLTFLERPEVDATNWRGEHAIRPAVVTRKNCGGGNRTDAGAHVQEVLMSVFRTCAQQARDAIGALIEVFRAPASVELRLAAAGA
jgi:transposase